MLISCAVTAQLICSFVFAYAKIRFSHVAAQITTLRSILNRSTHPAMLTVDCCVIIIQLNETYLKVKFDCNSVATGLQGYVR